MNKKILIIVGVVMTFSIIITILFGGNTVASLKNTLLGYDKYYDFKIKMWPMWGGAPFKCAYGVTDARIPNNEITLQLNIVNLTGGKFYSVTGAFTSDYRFQVVSSPPEFPITELAPYQTISVNWVVKKITQDQWQNIKPEFSVVLSGIGEDSQNYQDSSSFTMSFADSTGIADVSCSHFFAPWIKRFVESGVGAADTYCPAGNFCPDSGTRRDRMARFLYLGLQQTPDTTDDINHPNCEGDDFGDVNSSNPSCNYIEGICHYSVQIANGCQVNPPLYCPSNIVKREQMAKFFRRALKRTLCKYGSGSTECLKDLPYQGLFNDVTTANIFWHDIEIFSKMNITAGCTVNPPNYCPATDVSLGQMARFVMKAFNLKPLP